MNNQSQSHKPDDEDDEQPLPVPVDTYSPLAYDASVDDSTTGDISHSLAHHVEQVHVYKPDEENELQKHLSAIPEEKHDPMEIGVHHLHLRRVSRAGAPPLFYVSIFA